MALPWQISDEEKERQMPYLPPSLQAAPGAIAALDSRLADAEGTLAAATDQASPDTLVLRDANGEATFSALQISTTATATGAPGKLIWNDADGTLEFQLKGGNVTLQIGQEQVLRVRNDEATPLADGEVVYVTGSTGIHNTVLRASKDTETASARTIGVVTEAIPSGSDGYVTTFGVVRGLNTNHLTEGALVYLGLAGATTATPATAPHHNVVIGYCIKKSAGNGAIFVHVQNGFELHELHDVLLGAQAEGDVLVWDDTTKVWRNKTPSALPYVLKAGDTMTGDLTISGNKSLVMSQAAIYNLTRTIPVVVGNYVELGSITNVDFAGNVEIWYNAHNNNFSQSKRYFLPLSYHATAGAWQKLLPFSTTGQYAGNDADLEIRVSLGVATFRIRRTLGAVAGVADVVFLLGGSADETTWTPLTGTGTGVAPTAFYSVKAEGTNSDFVGGGLSSIPFTNRSLIQAGNFPATIGSYSLASWNSTGARVPLFACCPTNNGGSTPAAAQPALVLGRDGVNGQAYGNMVEFKLKRAAVVGVEARTQLDIALTHGAAATAGTDVISLLSTGEVQVPGSLKVGGGTALTKAVVYTPTLTPAATVGAGYWEQTFTVAGLTTADTVTVNGPAAAANTVLVHARVSAADTLALTWITSAAATPATGTYRVLAVRS